jgi:hypothetical protein
MQCSVQFLYVISCSTDSPCVIIRCNANVPNGRCVSKDLTDEVAVFVTASVV